MWTIIGYRNTKKLPNFTSALPNFRALFGLWTIIGGRPKVWAVNRRDMMIGKIRDFS